LTSNSFLCELLGFDLAYFLGKRLWEIGLFKDIAASEASFLELQEKGYVRLRRPAAGNKERPAN